MSTNDIWQGRDDTEDGEKGYRWHHVIDNQRFEHSCNLQGFASDLGVMANKGRPGAVEGPTAIRRALANCAWHLPVTVFDSGDVSANNNLAESQSQYAQQIEGSVKQHDLTIGLGGGHEIAWGSYLGLKNAIESEKNIGIVNFDAHFDLRKPAPDTSSGTPFRQIHMDCQSRNVQFNYACLGVAKTANTAALFEYAKQSDTRYLLDESCNVKAAKACLQPMLKDIDELYITVCLDAFSAHLAPGVSAPSAYGISLPFVIEIIRWLADSQQEFDYRWALADIAEMNPAFDLDNRTAKLAARIVNEMIEAKF